jgi:PAS domain S-box-containing protein
MKEPHEEENGTLTLRPPEFEDDVLAGLRDYWGIYERHYEEIRLVLTAELSADEEVGRLIRTTPPEVMEENSRVSRELSQRAIMDGDWEPYLESLKSQGSMYAQGDLSFAAWFRITSAFRPHMVRHMLAAFGADTQRLIRAIDALDRLLDLVLSVIGESYLERKEQIIARQREAIGESRVRSRYAVVLASIADGVVTTDPYGNVMTANPAMERISGVPEEEAIGRPYHQVYPAKREGRILPQRERFLAQAIKQGETILSEGVDVDLVCRDGREVPVSITAAPIVEEGRIVGGVGVIRELPERARS